VFPTYSVKFYERLTEDHYSANFCQTVEQIRRMSRTVWDASPSIKEISPLCNNLSEAGWKMPPVCSCGYAASGRSAQHWLMCSGVTSEWGGRAENNNKKQVFRQKILLQHVVMTATSMLNIWPVWTKLDPDDFAVQRSALSSAVLAEPLALRRLLHLYAQGVESGRAPLATHQVTPCRGGSMNCFSVTLDWTGMTSNN